MRDFMRGFMRLPCAVHAALLALALCAAPAVARADEGQVTLIIFKAGWIFGGSAGSGVLTFHEAKVRWPGEPCWVLSLGTGAPQQHMLQLRDSGLFGWGPNIVDVLLTASADSTDAILQVANLTRTEGRPLYDRVQVVLPEATGLDDVSSLGMLEELGREAIRHRLDTGYNLPTKPM